VIPFSKNNGQVGIITIKSDKDVREALAILSQNKQWIILSMQLEEQSLEDVFQTLTK
jgi:Holliday junction resolvasome RuvABC endonuclease subunit